MDTGIETGMRHFPSNITGYIHTTQVLRLGVGVYPAALLLLPVSIFAKLGQLVQKAIDCCKE